MIRVKDMDQLELQGLEIWRQQYSSAKLKLLEKSWADTLYGSQANVEKALKNNINLIAPASGKKSLKGFESFKINFKTNEIESCPISERN